MEKHLKNMKNKKYPERFSGKASFFFRIRELNPLYYVLSQRFPCPKGKKEERSGEEGGGENFGSLFSPAKKRESESAGDEKNLNSSVA